jgi:hypothetical protein
MEKKTSKINKSRKERRQIFGEKVDMKFYYKSQGKIIPSWPTITDINNFIQRKKIVCSVCKEISGTTTFKDDYFWYCEKCEQYYNTTNKYRREHKVRQNPKVSDYQILYEVKLWLQYQVKKLKRFLIRK